MRLAISLTLLSLTQIYCSNDYDIDYDDVLNKGILFTEESKIIIAEKFIPVQFLVPFPSYNFTLKTEIKDMLAKLNDMWKLPSAHCPLDFSSPFHTNESYFNVDWMFNKIHHEVNQSKADIKLLRNETSTFLGEKSKVMKSTTNEEKHSRNARGAHIGALAAAGLGLFGSGLIAGGSADCGLTGIFGTCQDQSETNAANIEHLGTITSVLTSYVSQLRTNTDEKFFLVSNKLKAIEEAQAQMTETQNKNWQVIQEQFNVIETNFNILRDCNQMLFSNQQLNFNFDTMASLLSLLYADVKSYRASVYTYRVNVLNAIPILMQKLLPISLVPKESLQAILKSVGEDLTLSGSRLSLAIPYNTDLLSYYEAKLLRDVVTVEKGLILTLAIPLASRTTAYSTYRAKVVPMPQSEPRMAIRWVIENPYLAVSEDQDETVTLSQQQFDRCIGSSKYKICHEQFPSQSNQPSCLATLFLGSILKAAETCDTEVFYLPTNVQAENLGYGIWLLTSATDAFSIRTYSLEKSLSGLGSTTDGCKICLLTVDCGYQVKVGDNIKLRSDLEVCDKIDPKTVDVKLPDPLEHLMNVVPDLDSLPYFESRTIAGVDLLKKVLAKLLYSPKVESTDDLVKIAMPLTMEMSSLNPSFKTTLKEYVPLKMSLTLSVVVFVINLFLHLLFMWAYHKFKLIRSVLSPFITRPHGNLKPCFIMDVKWEDKNEVKLCMERYNELKRDYDIFVRAEDKLISFESALAAVPSSRRSSIQSRHHQSERNLSSSDQAAQDETNV